MRITSIEPGFAPADRARESYLLAALSGIAGGALAGGFILLVAFILLRSAS